MSGCFLNTGWQVLIRESLSLPRSARFRRLQVAKRHSPEGFWAACWSGPKRNWMWLALVACSSNLALAEAEYAAGNGGPPPRASRSFVSQNVANSRELPGREWANPVA